MHSIAVAYVLGMVGTALVVGGISAVGANHKAKLMVEGEEYDLRVVFALLCGLLWPVVVAIALIGSAAGRWATRFVEKSGVVDVSWHAKGLAKPIPGSPDRYPQPSSGQVHDGRLIGKKWGLLLVENALGDGAWHCVGKREGSGAASWAVQRFDDEDEARRAFRWTTERQLEDAHELYEARARTHA